MKFRLWTTRVSYTKEEAEELSKLGFEFKPLPYKTATPLFYLTNHPVIEISTVEEMMSFVSKVGDVILLDTHTKDGIPLLEIYDDYRE